MGLGVLGKTCIWNNGGRIVLSGNAQSNELGDRPGSHFHTFYSGYLAGVIHCIYRLELLDIF
jgi:hypothetical protein